MTPSRISDVIVVGGGVSGLSTALHLRRLGVPKVTVLERHHVGAGQSGRAAGIIRALVNHTAISSILMESLQFFRNFEEQHGERLPIHQIGYLLVDHERQAAVMDRAIHNATAAGCQATRISEQEASELQPGLRCAAEDIYAYEPGAIQVDPMLATQALARTARRMGVEIVEGCEAHSILVADGRVTGVDTTEGRRLGNTVALATSVLGAGQLRALGVDVPVYPHRAEMAFFSVFPNSQLRLQRVVSDARTLLYLRPEATDQMFVGWREGDRISSPAQFASVDPENYRQTSNYASLADMQRRLTSTLPFMADGFVHRTYACVYDYTPDGMPILDRAETVSGLYFALGFSGGGFSLCPWVGSTMARLITEEAPAPEASLFRLRRFAEGQLLSWSNTSAEANHG